MPLTATAPARRRTASAGAAVFLADGDADLLDRARRFLLLYGFEVETATGGVECLAGLRRRPEGVLVLDADLPGGGADGVLAVMQEDPRLRRIPVILASARPPAEPPGSPVVGLVEKPFPFDSLLGHVRAAAGRMSPGHGAVGTTPGGRRANRPPGPTGTGRPPASGTP